MLTVITFKWASAHYRIQYTSVHANIVQAMVRKWYDGPLRFILVTDDPEGFEGETFPLWDACGDIFNACGHGLPSCYRRLKLFDPEMQTALGIGPGDRLVNIDLDIAFCGPLNPLWDRDEDFVGWAVAGSFHPRVFNGSMWMLKAGAEAHVWKDFDPATSPAEAKTAHYLGSDQAWMSYRLPGRAGWTRADGIYSYPLTLRKATAPPDDCRAAIFHGFEKPWLPRLPAWVRDCYRLCGRGRCLILGYAESVWEEAERALSDGKPFDGVIASPEAAEMWPGPVSAIARSDDEAVNLARIMGFDEFRFCGRTVPATVEGLA